MQAAIRTLIPLACTVATASAIIATAVPATASPPPGDPDCIAALEAGEHARAAERCRPGARDGNPVDQFNLALALAGRGGAPDDASRATGDAARARRWLERAAEQGLVQASHVLGNMLLDAGDRAAGLKRLASAARAGLPDAQYDYATALLEQPEGRRDAARILEWYGRAAAGGAGAARYNLAVLKLKGALGERDPVTAWAWLQSMPGLDGHSRVARLANDLFSAMTDDERARARSRLRAIERDPVAAARRGHADGSEGAR
jgi:TPR repeat protein